MELLRSTAFDSAVFPVDVSIVMPCLNEVQSLPHCIANARDALRQIEQDYGLAGEIVIADNGSTDGSQQLATSLGARVVPVARKGYGAAILGGFQAAFGRFLVMGDADGSYDFTDSVAMIGKLTEGADLCMGSRFRGGIAPGAMPWKNRYIGNPALTGMLNLLFRSGIDDAHCGLRAIRKDALDRLNLAGSGMEFASEMVIKASLKKMQIAEVPATLSPDLRDRAPHLRPWRDGWRHLRYLFMLSPTWVFGVPGLAALMLATIIFGTAGAYATGLVEGTPFFGVSWCVIAAFLASCGHFCLLMGVAMHFHGVRSGYRRLRPSLARLSPLLTLETMLVAGLAIIVIAMTGLGLVGMQWSAGGFEALHNPLALIGSTALGAIGLQTLFGAFVLAIIAGNDNRLTPPAEANIA